MALLNQFKDMVDKLIDNWGSDVTFTPITKSSTYGGYSGSESEATASEIETLAVPSNFMNRQYGLQKFGDSEFGTAIIIIKSEINFTTDVEYKATWDNQSWNVDSIDKRGHLQNTYAFKVVTLKKQI